MCPPPAEPIRPVGPLGSDVYVERTGYAHRAVRRRAHDDDDEREEGRDRAARDDDASTWTGREEAPYEQAGGYDDHGRTAATEPPAPAAVPHVDTTA